MKKVARHTIRRNLKEDYDRTNHTFEYDDLVGELADRALKYMEDGDDIEEIVLHAMDDGLMYTDDEWTMIKERFVPNECSIYDEAFEYLFRDVESVVEKELEDRKYTESYRKTSRRPLRIHKGRK